MKIAITVTAENLEELAALEDDLGTLFEKAAKAAGKSETEKPGKKPKVVYEGESTDEELDEVPTKKSKKKAAVVEEIDEDEAPVKKAKKKVVEEADEDDDDAADEDEVTIEDIRQVLQGIKDKTLVKPILAKFKTDRITSLDKKHYPAFYKKIQALPQIK